MDQKQGEYLEKAKRCFAGHKASAVLQTDDFLVIDWRSADGSSEYYVRYIVDVQRGSLIIQGDLGQAIACWYNKVVPGQMYGYVDDAGYFAGKIRCATDLYSYDWQDVLEDIEEYRRSYALAGLDPEADADRISERSRRIDELVDALDESCYAGTYSDDAIYALQRIDPDWWDGLLSHLGKRVSGRVYLWAAGYRMAYRQLFGRPLE